LSFNLFKTTEVDWIGLLILNRVAVTRIILNIMQKNTAIIYSHLYNAKMVSHNVIPMHLRYLKQIWCGISFTLIYTKPKS